MKKLLFVALALTAVLAITPAAKASSFSYDFVLSSNSNVSGVFTIYTTNDLVTGGVFDITGTGDANFHSGDYTAVGGVLAGGYGSVGFLDGSYMITLSDAAGVWSIYNSDGTNETLDLSAVIPEPSSLLLLGSGLFLLAGGLFWKSRSLRPHLAKKPVSNVIQAA